jgi:hypothetical protein
MWRRVHGRRAWLASCAVLVCAGTAVAAAGGLAGDVVGVAGAAVGFSPGPGASNSTTFTTSTTHHTTYTRVDLPTIQAYQTTVRAGLGASLVFEQTVAFAPGSAEVQATEAQASAALQAAGAGPITGPTPVAQFTTCNTAHLGDQLNHTEATVTTTASLGPGTILIGDDQSQTFFVQAGTTNYNTNTHTETFTDQIYQQTCTTSAFLLLTADPADRPRDPPPVAAGQSATVPAAPAPTVAQPAAPPPVVASPRVTG